MKPSRYQQRPRKPVAPEMQEAFVCRRFAVKLTRHICGKMYRQAHGSTRVGHEAAATAGQSRCKGCEIGRSHAKGRVHEGVELVQITPQPSGKAMRKRRWFDDFGPTARYSRRSVGRY